VDQEPSLARLAAGQLREPTGDGGWRFVTLPSREGAGDGAVDASSSGTLDLDLDRLVAALQRPARTFLRERLGVVLPDELESSPRLVELWPQGSLESWRLGDDLLRTLLDGGTVQDWMTARPARGGLPPGRLGSEHMARLAEEVLDLVDAAGLEPVAGTPLTPAASPIHLEVPVHGIAGELAGVRRVRLTGTVRHHDGRIVDLAYTRDHRRHVVGAWVGLLAATAAGIPVASAHVVRRPPSDRPVAPVVRDLAVAGADDAARAEQARVTLVDLVDLALRIRSAPVALLPRAGWALARGERDAAALKRDLDDTATALVLGSPTLADHADQRSTAVDEGLPEGDHPAQRWGLAIVGALARSTGSEA
jgi:exonuclease V gamma subunit